MACALPKVFFRVNLVKPMRCSQKPPNHGARLGINFHSTPLCARAAANSVDVNSIFSSSAAAKKVEPLSDKSNLGRDLHPANLRNACRKHSTVRSLTISRCTAWHAAQVNRQR